ncbi:MAG TPA: hypothetical protein VJW76_16920, partial [Verrucomicrobiae bacterium]|nr:hypothetical protein [Verrucomicrobiae bacterium]
MTTKSKNARSVTNHLRTAYQSGFVIAILLLLAVSCSKESSSQSKTPEISEIRGEPIRAPIATNAPAAAASTVVTTAVARSEEPVPAPSPPPVA